MPNIRAVSFDAPSQGQQVYATEDDIARQRALAEALLKGSSGIQNIQSPWQGVAQMTQAAMGGLNQRAADRKEEARQQAMARALQGMYGAGGDGAAAADPQAMATIMALDPRLGMQIEENRRAATRQAQQDAFARQRFEWEQRQAERAANAPITGNPGQVFLDPNTMEPRYTVPNKPAGPMEVSPGASLTAPGPDGTYNTLYTAPTAPKAPGDRPHTKGPDGIERFIDTGEPVFPGVEPQPDPPKFSDITSARKEFENQPGVSRYRVAAPILASMIKSVDDPSAMSDLDFIYGMAKIFDPTSVVRESEMGLVLQGQSIPQQITGLWQRAANGESVLQGGARADLIRSTGVRVGEYRQQAEREAQEFGAMAQRHGLNPADVVRGLEPMPVFQPPEAPAPASQTPLSSLPRVTDDASYDALPSGAEFVDPNGTRRRKP